MSLPAPEIFKAYDVRGIVGTTLTAEAVTQIGLALGTEAKLRDIKTIAVGRDGRLSGPELFSALAYGITRTGTDVIDIGMAPTPVTYFAADPLEGLIQPLVTSRESSQAAAAGEPQRVAVLAAADTPARLLIDALDSLGIVVESVSSLWQASATAWNSAATLQTSSILPDAAQIDAEQPTAATIVADGARLAWGWSQAGRLVCGGSIRVSPSQPPTAESNELAPLGGGPIDATSSALPPAPPLGPFADEADVPRLVAEWLAWSLQTGAAPNRITCLLNGSDRDTDSSQAAARFGRALGTSWAGATVDIVTSADAVGATLRRLCEVLDSTPAVRSAADNAALPTGLASLELRPGRSHRAMYIWSSVALTALAGALGILSWRTAAATVAAKNASEEWRRGWESVAEQSFPDALSPKPGVSASMQMWDEVRRLEDARRPADRAEPALPVMQELDSLSYVLSDPAYSLDSVEIDSKGTIRVIAVANDIAAAELLFEAIKLVAGTNSVDWTATYRARTDKGESKVTATFNAKWDPALLTPPTRTPL